MKSSRLPWFVLTPVLLSAAVVDAAHGQPAAIFADGFESGDTSAWGPGGGGGCLGGLSPSSLLAGDLGSPPGGSFRRLACLEVRNDGAAERDGEIAHAGIPLPESAALLVTDRLVLVGPGNRRLAAQFDVLSRWGGTVDDPTKPIRWLEISLVARVAAGGITRYQLRDYASTPAAAADPFAVAVTEPGGLVEVDTGLATFVLDPASPALFDSILVDPDDTPGGGRTQVYSHTAGAGPRLVFAGGSGDVTLSTASAGEVTVDAGSFEIVERGPTKGVVTLEGHFAAPGGASLCSSGGGYERFGFTVVATFVRASRDILLEVIFRNECSDAFTGPWFDEDVVVRSMSWELPFAVGAGVSRTFGGSSAVAVASGTEVIVEQARGSGTPWQRRARVRVDGGSVESAETFQQPVVAVAGDTLVVEGQVPWMRFREPQAVAVNGTTLSLRFVGETLNVGEGKGIWNRALVRLTPAGLVQGGVAGFVESRRAAGVARLERRLLVRAALEDANRSLVFPSLGTAAPSAFKTTYEATMSELHQATITGAWSRGKVYGSQLWPDVTSDPYAIGLEGVDELSFPNEFSPSMNYWDPAGAELLEFLRTGDPRWVWDYALAAHRLQLFTAYLNIGDRQHGNRAGFAVTSGGPGCEIGAAPCTGDGTAGGEWHRTEFGSDDYSYDMGMELAYVLDPSPAIRRRFAQAGTMVVGRYSIPQVDQGTREIFVNQVDVNRQVIQHFEMLANCAEFVPGAQGQACHDRLREVVSELAEENLAAGPMCQGDVSPVIAGTTNSVCGPPQGFSRLCSAPQQFMKNALLYPFFHRYYRNYGDPPGTELGRSLVAGPLALYEHGIDKEPDGVSLDVDGDWASVLECNLSASDQVLSCVPAPDSDGLCSMYLFSRPQTAALLLMAHELDPTIGLCQVVKTAYDDPGFLGGWGDNVTNGAGWWKGAAQMMQSMVFGVGIYDTCSDP